MMPIDRIVIGLTLSLLVAVGQAAEKPSESTQVSPRIVGGEDANPDDYPFFAKVFADGSSCGGVLISDEWLLTAGHCVYEEGVVAAADTFARIDTEILLVSEIYLHQSYNDSSLDYDYALLKLSEPYAGNLELPILASASIYQELTPDADSLTVIGFGYIAGGGPPATSLQQVQIPLITVEQCREFWSGQLISNRMFCAYHPERDACNGDSGGPVLFGSPGSFQLVGLVSWGDNACIEMPGGYADVGVVRSWIDGVRAGDYPASEAGELRDSGGDSGGATGLLWWPLLLCLLWLRRFREQAL
ncbi:serine protease [Aliagarivorans taiwanensis]|uniref:serine protease n=1 Tax=Aliagarivorans taiwanensis TaxID=561966 RepID=UPI00041A9978|nr:serine protease [Aliagarivorans taiwanensis]